MPDFIEKELQNILMALPNCVVDDFLEILLKGMSYFIEFNKSYRRNIEGFNARYCFKTSDGSIAASVIFKDNEMKLEEEEIDNTNLTVTFRDGNAMKSLLSSPNPDIISAIMNNELSFNGNLNYLLKFAYMAKTLQLKLIPT